MKKIMTKLLFSAVVVLILSAGCEEKEAINTRQARLVGAQNLQLKKEIQELKTQLKTQKNTYEKKLAKQEKSVEQLNQKNQRLQNKLSSRLEAVFTNNMKEILNDVTMENKRLKKENEQLKKQIEELENN